MGTPCELIYMGYLKLTTARTEYLDNWICNETLFRLLSAHIPHLKNNTFKFTRKLLIQAIGAKAGPFHGKHEHSTFSKQFQTSFPYDDTRRRVTYFYRQDNGEPPANPVSSRDITDVHARNNQIRRNVIRQGLVNEAAVAAAMATTITPQRSRRTTAPSSEAEPMSEGGDETMVGGATSIDARRGGCGSVPIYYRLIIN
jgi:hypothetical protein